MASPTLDLLCCVFRKNASVVIDNVSQFNDVHLTKHKYDYVSYGYAFCITLFASAFCSIIGAGFTLMPKPKSCRLTPGAAVTDDRQRTILSCLTGFDLMACAGLLVLSISTMTEMNKIVGTSENKRNQWMCIITSAWVQFFYIATYFWTLCYALDVYLMLKNINWKILFWIYLSLTLLLSAVIVAVSMNHIYVNKNRVFICDPSIAKISGIYWGVYSILIFVMIALPVLYYLSSKEITPMLKRGGIYTDRERKLKKQIQKKFLGIVIIFYVCWLPNILNVVVLLQQLGSNQKSWHNNFLAYQFIWILMAVLNPLQALLNTLVYWGPAGCSKPPSATGKNMVRIDTVQGEVNWSGSPSHAGGSENAPLLRSMQF